VPAGRQQVGQRKDATKDAQTVAKANKKATLAGGFFIPRSQRDNNHIT
jgi:hypothetical protein